MKKAAGIIFLSKSGQVLFLQRGKGSSDHHGEWAFPAGSVEPGEVEIQTAVREALEETGIVSIDPQYLDTFKDADLEFWLFVEEIDGCLPTLNDEHTAFAWAPALSPPQPLHPGAAMGLRALLQAFPLLDPRYVYQQGELEPVYDIDEIDEAAAPQTTVQLDLPII